MSRHDRNQLMSKLFAASFFLVLFLHAYFVSVLSCIMDDNDNHRKIVGNGYRRKIEVNSYEIYKFIL